jgi:Thioredoxin
MEENRAVAALSEALDDKYSKRRSQKLRLMLRCCCFVTVFIVTVARLRYQGLFRFVHDHHLQSYVVDTYFLRNQYLSWLEEYQNSPLIPRMLLPHEEPAFDVVDDYDTARRFLKETTPPFFVLHYANWCSHSARAIPVVQEFAKTVLRSQHIPLMAIEADNPLSDKIEGFPTLYLYLNNGGRGGSRIDPKEFTSKMLVTNLVAFLNQNVPVQAKDGLNPPPTEKITD